MKKVLMIAYYFPPLATIGTYRTLKFVKYLRKFGWEPVVLTVKQGFCWEGNNEALLEEIPDGVKVFRTHSFEPINICRKYFGKKSKPKLNDEYKGAESPNGSSLIVRISKLIIRIIDSISIPDENIAWLPLSIYKARNIILREKIDIVYSSGKPWTGHLIGYLLKKIVKKSWVVDFRDPWKGNPLLIQAKYPRARLKLEEFMEHCVLKSADKIVSVSQPIIEAMKSSYPDISHQKFTVITNGFDPADFQNINCQPSKKFTIAYLGSFYHKQTPKFFIEAIRALIEENKELETEIQILFVGLYGKENAENLKCLNLNKVVRLVGIVSHQRCIEYMAGSDVFLLTIGAYPGAEGTYTGKLFEYLAMKKPILALVPEGVAADLIRSSRTGIVVEPENVEAIKQAVYNMYLEYKQKELEISPDLSIIEKYGRIKLTQKLACILENISSGEGKNKWMRECR